MCFLCGMGEKEILNNYGQRTLTNMHKRSQLMGAAILVFSVFFNAKPKLIGNQNE